MRRVFSMLVGMSMWTLLLLLAIGIFWTLQTILDPKGRKARSMFTLGLFLAVFDWIFETSGFFSNYWTSAGAVLFIGPAVPLDVFLIAFFSGATMSLLFPRKFTWNFGLPTAVAIGATGTVIEALLITTGNLSYHGTWTSFHAFVWYFIVFLGLQKVNELIQPRR
jgi:hypothetical protein